MTNAELETRTYFGETLEELLPKIREELGPDALIVRQREGIVGGIGGFFGRKCVEVEARPSLMRASLPPRTVVDAYDTGDPWVALPPEMELEPEVAGDEIPGSSRLLETLLAQTSPFAEQLSSAIQVDDLATVPPVTVAAAIERPVAEADSTPVPEPVIAAPAPRLRAVDPEPAAPEPVAAEPVAAPPGPAPFNPAPFNPAPSNPAPSNPAPSNPPISLDELAAIRRELVAAAVPVRMVGEILAEVEQTLRPFEPGVPVRDLARRALAHRIPVASGWSSKKRTIALVGLRHSGRTLAAAGLCAAFVRDGRSVAAVSLEPVRAAMRFAELTSADDVTFQVADAPDLAARIRGVVRDADVVVADTPPLADAIDGNRLAATLALLGALKPDETHLVVPATMSVEDARILVDSLSTHKLPSRLIVTHADSAAASGAPVGLALANRIPISFMSAGPALGALRPAAPEVLARMVLQ
jgi:flagellar biosynthesis GTPase FlhF